MGTEHYLSWAPPISPFLCTQFSGTKAAPCSLGGMLRALGLRAQILLALTAAYALSAGLLVAAVLGLTGKARQVERVAEAQQLADAVADSLPTSPADGERDAITRAVVARGNVARIEVRTVSATGTDVVAAGEPARRAPDATSERLRHPGDVRVWIATPIDEEAPLAPLLVLYVVVTAAAVLLLAYLTLGGLIVRPVEGLTRAAERLATGARARVPESGARELAGLARAFNTMADDLARDRATLEARLLELERTTDELRRAQDQVVRSEKLASVGRLAAGLAHEIGNPLAAVLGLVELLREGGLDADESKELLARTHTETERIHAIVRQLLDFSRQGSTDDDASAKADLREVVADAVKLVTPQKRARAVKIEVKTGTAPVPVRGAHDRLVQVVVNLLLNAADAMNGEGVAHVDVATTDGGATLTVRDTGPGIAPAVLATLFEPFVTTKPAGEGTGLGLAVSHTIVTRAGGTITADNAPEGGARFVVRLAIAQG